VRDKRENHRDIEHGGGNGTGHPFAEKLAEGNFSDGPRTGFAL